MPGGDRPSALAQGVQRRLQVHRQARRGRGPDTGHLRQDLQVAAHVRPPGQLPDLAHQHQPEPVHRPLPQRPQGARDDLARRGRRGDGHRRRAERLAGIEREISAPAAARSPSCRRRCGRRCCCATSRNCPTRKSPTCSTCPKARSSPASTGAARNLPGRSAVCGTSSNGTKMNLTTEHHDVAVVRVGEARMVYPILPDFATTVTGARQRRAQGADRPDAGHLPGQRHDRLPDGPVPADLGRRRRGEPAGRAEARRDDADDDRNANFIEVHPDAESAFASFGG